MDGVGDWWRLSFKPDEGTVALLFRDTPHEYERVVLGEFRDGEWRIHIDGQVIRDATHFMNIPPPPVDYERSI